MFLCISHSFSTCIQTKMYPLLYIHQKATATISFDIWLRLNSAILLAEKKKLYWLKISSNDMDLSHWNMSPSNWTKNQSMKNDFELSFDSLLVKIYWQKMMECLLFVSLYIIPHHSHCAAATTTTPCSVSLGSLFHAFLAEIVIFLSLVLTFCDNILCFVFQ